jgi:hypothetical protein
MAFGSPPPIYSIARQASHGRGGGARWLLQVCSQFDQQTAAAAAANAGLVVVGDGVVRAAAVAAESGLTAAQGALRRRVEAERGLT